MLGHSMTELVDDREGMTQDEPAFPEINFV